MGKRAERRVHPKCLSSLQATKPQKCLRNLQRKKPSELDIEIPPKGNWSVRTLGDDPWSVSKQRATLIFYKSSLKEKLNVIQGLEKEILDLSTEEEIVRQRN